MGTAESSSSGYVACCRSDEPTGPNDPNRVIETIDPDLVVLPKSEPMSQKQYLKQLSGEYARESDNMRMGSLKQGAFFWDSRFKYPPTNLHVSGDGDIEMSVSGLTHKARVQAGRLLWSDGEIWFLRKPQFLSAQPDLYEVKPL
mmetsp:Transcript_118072/g.220707  ORF Transcript_118072/g.220707 Transcript_118072/m.220707 type:complete len:144 (-) Transcript_118072:58-489(-)